jgi:hypothetical protein
MAKAGRIQHWKHGWIPISPEAKAYAAGNGPRPLTTDLHPPAEALKRAKARQAAFQAAQAAIKPAADIHSQQVGGYRITTVDGYPEVRFKEVMEVNKRPPEQYHEVAKIVQNVLKPYPLAAKDPITIGWSNELDPTVMADTDSRGGSIGHRIRLNTAMWDTPGATMVRIAGMKSRHWGVFAEASDLESFRRDVITHEIGHVLNFREQETHRNDGPIDQLVFEQVTPAELGYTRVAESSLPVGEDPPLGKTLGRLDKPTYRWRIDSLDKQSTYATTDPYEFFAEAFLDGTINGDKASESGKRAVARAKISFGGTL